MRGEDEIARLATSFNEMADALQRQILQLEELSRVQRRFTADVSHELRTPLTTVRMAADLLRGARRFPREVALGGAPDRNWTGSSRCSWTSWRSVATTPGPRFWRPSRRPGLSRAQHGCGCRQRRSVPVPDRRRLPR